MSCHWAEVSRRLVVVILQVAYVGHDFVTEM